MINSIFLLFILLQIKHFICDYPLQNAYMLQKANKENWIFPLALHSLVHAIGTFLVFSLFNILFAFYFALADFILHFIVDRIKASPNMGNRWGIDKPQFWWALGLDQMVHHIINIIFIYLIFTI